VQITRLRRKFETDPRQPRYLQTVRGEGYMLTPD
jgi:two-component system phosphate regulon response regulator OmpR